MMCQHFMKEKPERYFDMKLPNMDASRNNY